MMETPGGVRLERLVSGVGDPVTVFAHGLAGDIAGTRPLGSAVAGRRVFFLHVYDRPAVLWNNRSDLRQRISAFLNG